MHVTRNSTVVRPKSYYLTRFLVKTTLKSKKLDREGEACVPSAPLDPPMYCIGIFFSLRKRTVETETPELQELTLPVREILDLALQ